ncbi:two-component system sensor histidine kinase NtrB [Halobellus marinus]|uniref:two-component system sensor histidine kinase NtrB n=1 Tax=Halobellus TaxID=1073986 RepID=UPI0028AC4FFB|nr:PAS domain-containing sensor histidine kinase [Halobellus sp. DFY28]
MSEDLSLEAYRELIEHSTDILIIVDESGVIQYENKAVQRVTGYDPEERTGNRVFEYVHPDDERRVLEKFSEAINASDDKIVTAEFRFRHKDGSWVWLESRGVTQRIPSIDGYVVTLRDITQRKEYEEHLRREQDRLSRLVSIISHDLRNPLNVIEGNVELARAESESDRLDTIARAADRMDELIEDILTLAREGESKLQVDAVDLRELATSCWQNVATESSTLEVETDQIITADATKLQQVLENLFRNAVEHGSTSPRSDAHGDAVEHGSTSPRSDAHGDAVEHGSTSPHSQAREDAVEHGDESVTVTIGELENGFYVEDDGTGIPEDVRDSILEDGFSTKTDGTGLGLSIVTEIVESHGWDLTVPERETGGARFEITGVELVGD